MLRGPKDAEPVADVDQEALAMETFKSRVSAYRSSFNPYNRRAPGYDYLNWKPHGTIRDDNPSHSYTHTCRALGPYVRGVVESGMVGVEERMWVGVTGQSTGLSKPPSRNLSRAGSREILDTSRDNM